MLCRYCQQDAEFEVTVTSRREAYSAPVCPAHTQYVRVPFPVRWRDTGEDLKLSIKEIHASGD